MWRPPSRGVFLRASLSRVLVVLLAVLAHLALPEHEASGALQVRAAPTCRLAPLLGAFTRWDAAHFLAAARDGWTCEQRFAFFPLYPLLVRVLSAWLRPRALSGCEDESAMVAAVLLSNAAFVAATVLLFHLTAAVLRVRCDSARRPYEAALFFCVSPASVFFSTAYSEACFAASVFGGMLLLQHGRAWVGAGLLAVGSALRANGTLNALVVASDATRRAASAWTRPSGRAGAAELIAGGTQSALVLSPYALWVVAGHQRLCTLSGAPPPKFCARRWPDVYQHVQAEYWGVGFLRYYQLRQLPNFALAAPTLLACARACAAAAAQSSRRHWRAPGALIARGELADTARRAPPGTVLYLVHWTALTLIGLLLSNVQVTTRLVAAGCPGATWFFSGALSSRRSGSRWKRAARAYVVAFAAAGTVAHATFLPFI